MSFRFSARVLSCALAAVSFIPNPVRAQTPLGTAFTYQGQLKNDGSPVNGTVDLDFTLWNDPAASDPGNQVGSIQSIAGVSVSSGLFTVQLNDGGEFGPAAFNGEARWLEITVNGTTLAPRQPLTSTPYSQLALYAPDCNVANYAYSAGFASTPWESSGADVFYNAGNVGIGTSTPMALLDVIGTAKMDSFLLPTGAAAAKVLTSDGSGNGTWQDAAALTLPYSGSANAPSTSAFSVTNTAVVGINTGGFFTMNGSGGNGLVGYAPSNSGDSSGVLGQSAGVSGVGVKGVVTATSGTSYGVYGQCASAGGYGVYGSAAGIGAYGNGSTGVYGNGSSAGVSGYCGTTSGNAYGTTGYGVSSVGGGGVHGWAPSTTGQTKGVTGLNYSNQGVGVLGSAESASGTTAGVWGQASSPTGDGVYGICFAGTGNAGVHGYSNSTNGNGVIAEAPFGASAYALWAKASQGVGVRCDGALQVSGTKSFRIDHPFDPENKYLLHYCSESPEPLNTYTGNVTTDAAGYATIALPNYFEEINKDFRYQLTVVDATEDFVMAKVAHGVSNNSFQIRTSKPNVKVSWMVMATRNDRYVKKYGAPVEMEKPAHERGLYLDPALYSQPAEKGQGYQPLTASEMKKDAGSTARVDASPRRPAALDLSLSAGASSTEVKP